MEEEDTPHQYHQHQDREIVKALQALKRASEEVEQTASFSDDASVSSLSMKALLELETGSDDLFSGDPLLNPLRKKLAELRSLSLSAPSSPNQSFVGSLVNLIFRRPKSEYHGMVSRVAGAIASEIQSWVDRETLDRLVSALRFEFSDDERVALLMALETRAGEGFDRGFQDTLLKSGAFSIVESTLSDPSSSKLVGDHCASFILALVRFNKDVFVGPVLMGPTIESLVSIASPSTLRALNGLITTIRSPLIDELLSRGELQRLVSLLSSPNLEVRVLAFDFTLRIGYFGRKVAIEAMLAEGLIKRLLCLQTSDLGGAFIEMDGCDSSEDENGGCNKWIHVHNLWKQKQTSYLELRPFASAVARFSIQVEVGEGLRQREKRNAKLEILIRVKEAAISPVEVADVLTEVLWGSNP